MMGVQTFKNQNVKPKLCLEFEDAISEFEASVKLRQMQEGKMFILAFQHFL